MSLCFSKKGSEGEKLQQQKNLREDIENPIFVIDTPETSTSTTKDVLSVNTSKDENKTIERLAFRLNI